MVAAMLFQLAFNYLTQENVKFGTRLAMTLLVIAFAFMFSFITNRIKIQMEEKKLTKIEYVFVISVIALLVIYSGWTVYDSYKIVNSVNKKQQANINNSNNIFIEKINNISNNIPNPIVLKTNNSKFKQQNNSS